MNKSQEVKILMKADTNNAEKNIKNVNTNLKNTKNTADNATKSLKNINDKLTLPNLQSLIYGIKQITSAMQSSIQASVDYIENVNLTQTAFGHSAEEGMKFANTIADIYSFDESNVVRQVGTFRQFGEALGFADEKANMLGKNLTLFASDISSLYNITFEQASEKLSSALTGQTKAIRSLGADITMASLQQQLYNMGINESITDMNRAEKVLLIYLSLTKQLANAQGDLAKTIQSPSNQLKIMQEQIARVSRAFGNMFLPVLAKALPIVNGILMAIVDIFNFIGALLGYDPVDFDYGISINDSFDDAAGSIFDTNEGLDGTNEKLDETKKKLTGLRGFDKLNVINTPTEPSSGSSGGSSGGGVGGIADGGINSKLLDALTEYDAHLDRIKNKAKKIKEHILNWLGFILGIDGTIKGWSAKKLFKNIIDSFLKLNTLGKIFLALGLAAAVYNLFKMFKFLVSKSGLGGALSLIKMLLAPTGNLLKSIISMRKEGGGLNNVISKGVTEWQKTTTTWEKAATALSGLLIAVTGISLMYDAFRSINEEGASFSNVITLIIGGLMSLVGTFTVVTAATTAFGVTMTASLATATAGISLIISGLATLAVYLATNKSELEEYNEKMQDTIETSKEAADAEIAQINNVSRLADQLSKLADSNGKVSKSNQARVQYILTELNEALGTEYKLSGNQITQNGKVVKSLSEITKQTDKLIEKKKAKIYLDAYEDVYTEALKQNLELESKRDKKQEEYNKKLEAWKEKYPTIRDQASLTAKIEFKRLEDLLIEYEELDEQVETNNEKIKKYDEANVQFFEGNYEGVKDNIEKMANDTKTYSSKAATDARRSFDSKLKGLGYEPKVTAKDNSSYVKRQLDKNLSGRKYTVGITTNTNPAIDGVNAFGNALKNSDLKLNYTPIGYITPYAEGGFPDDGELFIAREKGPELVGSIGNRTAVANNDQIVEAVSIGVARAIQNAGSKNTRVVIEAKGDASGLMNFITFKQKEQERQYGL